MTKDESRAVAFLAVLLLLATLARYLNRPDPITITAAHVDVAALRAAGQSLGRSTPPAAGRRRSASNFVNPPPSPSPSPSLSRGPLDLNTATAAQLEALPGIGPAMAQRIIARRDSIGRFRVVEDLDSVRGIGPVLIEKLRARVTLKP